LQREGMSKVKPDPEEYLRGEPNYLPGTQIEIIDPNIARGQLRYSIWDFDGTISLLREGWEHIMGPVMVEAICGEHPPTPEIEKAVAEFIDRSTGIQTIYQMEHLVEMVREFGLVPQEKILDAWGYKQIYNERLMVPVRERVRQLERGEKKVEQFTLRGSMEFLKMLYDRGMTLYCFSGTDQEDVRNEARALGADKYFEGGIFGALRPVEAYSKDKVIKEILRRFDLHGAQLLVVGDGPVELKNAKENEAVALGVASDEARGYGLNAHKRKRVVRGGADILIADFSEAQALYDYLFPAG